MVKTTVYLEASLQWHIHYLTEVSVLKDSIELMLSSGSGKR